jgi:hypothetical protein
VGVFDLKIMVSYKFVKTSPIPLFCIMVTIYSKGGIRFYKKRIGILALNKKGGTNEENWANGYLVVMRSGVWLQRCSNK